MHILKLCVIAAIALVCSGCAAHHKRVLIQPGVNRVTYNPEKCHTERDNSVTCNGPVNFSPETIEVKHGSN